jgi:hypothetical protein
MKEEDSSTARAGTGRLVDDVETILLEVVESGFCVLDPEGHVSETSTAATLLDELLDGRLGGHRFEQLDEVGTVANLEENLTNLVAAADFFAMKDAKT